MLLCNIKTIFTTSIVNVTLETTLTALVQVDVLHVVGVVGGNVLVDVGVVGNWRLSGAQEKPLWLVATLRKGILGRIL